MIAVPSYNALIRQSWPIILANSTVPLLGLIDTAVIGHFGSIEELAALALASLIFTFVYWSFGFLRMGTTGFVARARGADNFSQILKVILQSSLIACVIALLILLCQVLIISAALTLLSAPDSAVESIKAYFYLRIYGAPATLLQFVLIGVFIGIGASKHVLWVQLCLNTVNAGLDVVFVAFLKMGIYGVALGTVIAEYATLLLSLVLLFKHFPLKNFLPHFNLQELRSGWRSLLSQNGDIFVRTLFLLIGFSFFTSVSASFGEVVLAANHVLLQYIAFCAFFLDGYAYVLESHAGNAYGKRNRLLLREVLKRIFVIAGVTAISLSLGISLFGTSFLYWLTDKQAVIEVATLFLPLVALYVCLSVAAYQLDGAFIGAGYSSAMRNSSIISTLVLVVSWYLYFKTYGGNGLWYAFNLYVLARSLTLFLYLPKLLNRCDGAA